METTVNCPEVLVFAHKLLLCLALQYYTYKLLTICWAIQGAHFPFDKDPLEYTVP